MPEWIKDIYYIHNIGSDFNEWTIGNEWRNHTPHMVCGVRIKNELTIQQSINRLSKKLNIE